VGYVRTAAYSGLYIENFIVGYTGNAHGNLGHTWSLALEEQFYLLWAPVLLLCLKLGRSVLPVLIGGILLSTALLEWATGPNDGIPLSYFRPETRANELLFGCLLAVLLPGITRVLAPMRFVRATITPVALLALAGVEAFVAHNTRITRYPLEEIWAGVAAGLLIVGLTVGSERSLTTRLFQTWPMVSIGRISYGMYLWLLPVVVVLPIYWHPWHGNVYVESAGTMAVIIAIATLSYFVVERPFLRLKEHFQVVKSSKSLAPLHPHAHAHAPGRSGARAVGRSYPPRPDAGPDAGHDTDRGATRETQTVT
jgi:peptidoglycan/LPS O-acetylase OafA/YrhL